MSNFFRANNGYFFCRIPQDIPPALAYTTILYRLLYELALDLFDKPNININVLSAKSPPLSRESSLQVIKLLLQFFENLHKSKNASVPRYSSKYLKLLTPTFRFFP